MCFEPFTSKLIFTSMKLEAWLMNKTESVEIFKSFRNKRVKYVQNKTNGEYSTDPELITLKMDYSFKDYHPVNYQ